MAENLKLTPDQLNRPGIRLSTRHGKATIEETSRYLQDKFKQNFSRSKTILDQAVFRWMKEIDEKDISERVNFEELNGILEKVFTNNGVKLPFFYSIVDKQGKIIYKCHKDIPDNISNSQNNIYTQRLFPLEEAKLYYEFNEFAFTVNSPCYTDFNHIYCCYYHHFQTKAIEQYEK